MSKIKGRLHSFEFETKSSANSKVRKIKGFANKSIVDRANEVIEPEAFSATKTSFMKNPVMLSNHNPSNVIGKITSFDIKTDGVFVEAEVGKGFEPADTVWKQISQGLVSSFSVGFIPKRIEFNTDGSGPDVIKELDLLEISVVSIPMNAESIFEVSSKGIFGDVQVAKDLTTNWVSYKSLLTEQENGIICSPASTTIDLQIDDKENAVLPGIQMSIQRCMVCRGDTQWCIDYCTRPDGKTDYICPKCFDSIIHPSFDNKEECNQTIEELQCQVSEFKDTVDELIETQKTDKRARELSIIELDQCKQLLQQTTDDYSKLQKKYKDLVVNDILTPTIDNIVKDVTKMYS